METRCSPTHAPECFGSHLPLASAWGEPLPPPAIPLLSKADQMVGAMPGQGTNTQILPTKCSGHGDGHTGLVPGSPAITSPSLPTQSAPSSQNGPSGAFKGQELGTGSRWGGQQRWCEVAAVSTCPLADHETKSTKNTQLEPQRHQGRVWRNPGDGRRSKAPGRFMLAAHFQFLPRAIKSFLCMEMGRNNLNILPLALRHEEALEAY